MLHKFVRRIRLGALALACALLAPLIAWGETARYGDRYVAFGTSGQDLALKGELDRWYESQLRQDCENVSRSSPEVAIVEKALSEKRLIATLRSRPNPRGKGTIVFGWRDSNRNGSADYSRHRIAWLVLDGTIFPLSGEAGRAVSIPFTFDDVTQKVREETRLQHSFVSGQTLFDQIGLTEYESKRFQAGSEGNPFPYCPRTF